MSDLKVISAKISSEFFNELEDLRESLHILTRQELIERSLRLFLHSAKEASRQFTDIREPEQIVCLPPTAGKTDSTEARKMSEIQEKSDFSYLTDDELLILFKEADKPPAWLEKRVAIIEGGRA